MRYVFAVLAAVVLLSAVVATPSFAVGKYVLAYWRECAAYENQSPPAGAMGNHSCYIHVWNENGTPRAGVNLQTSWGVGMGTTDANGFYEATLYRPNGYDFQVVDGSNLTDTSPVFNQERAPNWGHYSYEVGFIYKADSTSAGTFDTTYDGVLNSTSDQPCNLDAPRTKSIAYYSTNPLEFCSDAISLGNWSDSFGQTFVANGNRVVAARCHSTLGDGSHLWYTASIHVGGPNGAQVGPSKTSREVVSDEYASVLIKWGLNDVQVTSGQTYYVKFVRTEGGGMNIYHVNANNYSSGQYYENGTSFSNIDLQGMVVCGNTTGGGPTTGTITGNVKNTSAQNISGASVSTNTGGYTATTDSSGNYTLSNVTPGSYTVTAAKSGYISSSNSNVSVTAGNTTTSNFTLTASSGGSVATEDFETMPSWSSTFDAAWGSTANWAITSGGQAGNFLQASRTANGSSVKAKVYTVPTNTNVTVSVYIKCPSYSGGTYWIETACKLGNIAASDFDANAGTWTMIKKFDNAGTNGNGNTWTQYSTTVATGSNTQITVGFKHGASGCVGPTVGWDSFKIDAPSGCTAPAITTQPTSQTTCSGQSVTFTVAASGTAPLSYQWKKGGTNISGATSASYTISSVATGDAASYTCYVSNACGNVTSNAATLTVNTAPAITTQPTSQTLCSGQSVTFTVAASGTSPSYQWKKGGTNISGATSASYTISSVTTGDAASYTCYVSNSCGNVTSNAATLTVNTAPAITTQPTSQTKSVGQSVTFTVAASGTSPSYQWRKGGTNISGATSTSYTIASVQTTDAGNYDCVVTNTCGSATSNVATLTVTGGVIASQDFETMPSWSSSFDAEWGSAATWAITSGGQSANFLQASRTTNGSSSKTLVFTVPTNTNVTVSVYMKCPSYSGGTYWIECAAKLGNQTATDFDGNSGTWTYIKKFSNSGTNGNGNVWTQYSTTIATGSNTQITIGFKHGASGCVGPTVGWDTLRIN